MKASCSGNYFACIFRHSLFWLLLVSSPFVIVQCSGGGSSGGGSSGDGDVVVGIDCETESSSAAGLTIVNSELRSQSAEFGDHLSITLTVKNQGTVTSGDTGMITFYRSDNKFISPKDEELGMVSFGAIEPNAESKPSFSFPALVGDNYYGACLGTTNNCQIGIKVSVAIPPSISGSKDYIACELSRADGTMFVTSISAGTTVLYSGQDTFTDDIAITQGQEQYYLLKVMEEGILDIWTTGSQDTVALLFDGNCNPIVGHYYVEDGGVGGEKNFQIGATASAGYYFLVLHEKSLEAATFQVKVRLFDSPVLGGTTDPLYPDQWHLNTNSGVDINAPEAWKTTRGCPSVLVAVIDFGVEVSHPDLAPNHNDRYATDYRYSAHGTAAAGVIVAAGNNGIGISGVAPEVGFVSLAVISESNTAVANALIKNKKQTAVSNNSWSFGSEGLFTSNNALFGAALEEGVTSGYGGKGIFYAFSGGNSAQKGDNSNYASPTKYYSVVAICAIGINGKRSSYSEKGANLWICAPSTAYDGGIGLVTTDTSGPSGFSRYDYTNIFGGTSAAAPVVSGVAALMRSANPNLGWRDVRLILAITAKKK